MPRNSKKTPKNPPTKIPNKTPAPTLSLNDHDYAALAEFRHSLRSFLAFSEQAARKAGLTPQQHQALLAVRGLGLEKGVTVGELAGRFLVKHHTTVGLVDRLLRADLLRPPPDEGGRARGLLSVA